MNRPASRLVCAGCGSAPRPEDPYPFRCPHAGEGDVDHVLTKVLCTEGAAFPAGTESQPFARYRALLHSYHRAVSGGMTDAGFLDLVDGLDQAVARVAGHGFSITPFARNKALSAALGFGPDGGVWVKDETANVAGSHKGRHFMGLLLHLEVSERLGLAGPGDRPDLAIASCGNAALAAAVVAKAAGRRLRVFVPADANPAVVDMLNRLDADVVACPRAPGTGGDPAYGRLREEVAAGALPFTAQGDQNGLAIEGGETIAYEIVSQLLAGGLPALDHLVVQVGGGALASSCVQGLALAVRLGALARMPKAHTVQTLGAHPLERAYRALEHLARGDDARLGIGEAIAYAASHRSRFMWPWEEEPKSIASGILDDETYDWLAVAAGMLRSGGRPVVVADERLAQAQELGEAAGFTADATGTAGLAGLIDLVAAGEVGPGERAAVLFTGTKRPSRGDGPSLRPVPDF